MNKTYYRMLLAMVLLAIVSGCGRRQSGKAMSEDEAAAGASPAASAF